MFIKKRMAPLLCALLILLTLVMPATPAQAADTAIIKAGTYRFNDVINFTYSFGNVIDFNNINFTVPIVLPAYGIDSVGTGIKIGVRNVTVNGVTYQEITYTVTDIEPSIAGFPPHTADQFAYVYSNQEGGWKTNYGEQVQFITITADAEVSAEFYEWFTANTVFVGTGSSGSGDNLLGPGPSGFVGVLDVFDSVGGWLSGAVDETTSIFYADGQMTFIGEVAIACVCISFALLVLFLISKWLCFK